jgi:elongator complex protein 3
MKYDSSEGADIFISMDDLVENVLIGYVRLRFPSKYAHRPEINTVPTAIIREIRVVGELVAFNHDPNPMQVQHRGIGKMLLEKAERIAIENSFKKMVIISGIGVKEYFKKFGYEKDGPYVSKNL